MPRGKLLNGLVTQQKVLRAAVALFLEKGYTRTTTGEIAKAAGIGQSSFFHVFPSKEALLLELVKRMFSGQFALAGQHSGEQDPVLLYAVETALQLHIAELTEPLRELYVMAYSLPSIAAYLYKSTMKLIFRLSGSRTPFSLEFSRVFVISAAFAGSWDHKVTSCPLSQSTMLRAVPQPPLPTTTAFMLSS